MLNTERIRMTTMGPIGHIYIPLPITGQQKEIMAKQLVAEVHIPLVFFIKQDQVMAANRDGIFDLLNQSQKVLGQSHPFLQWTACDLERTCRHPNAGDLVISGWTPNGIPLSFSIENGAHGGPGNEETRGFVLLPNAIDFQEDALRPLDLRKIILNGFKSHKANSTIGQCKAASQRLKIMTYNIHSCVGMNGRIGPDKIAQIIANLDPDIVALQEVDANRRRTHYTNQAKYLARKLNMEYQYFSIINRGSEKYGLAILGKYPLIKVKYDRFPTAKTKWPMERRGAMWIRVRMPRCDINIVNTHFGLQMRDRILQVRTLFGDDWLSGVLENHPLVVCGDFNAGARSPVYREICTRLADVQKTGNCRGYPKPTFFSRYPVLRLDHIFVSRHFTPLRVQVPGNPLTRMASDHLPVFTELMFNSPADN
jgi:endonuclease/exonuclease/phosphatase family metal-dependent hydrolase